MMEDSSATSLDRLKSLDSFPDLESSIAEATKLCTHEARAEMITRWITSKLKQTISVGLHKGTWDLLTLTTRLLAPQKIAALLGSIDFYQVISSLLKDSGFSKSLLRAIQQFLSLLLNVGNGQDGAPIRAVISGDGANVSTFCGAWFSSVLNGGVEHLLDLDIPLELWALRKQHHGDNAVFTQHCLVPILGLLSVIETDLLPISSKRDRGDNISKNSIYYQRSLRSMLASHSILPARAAVKKARDAIPAVPTNGIQETATSALDDLLTPFRAGSNLDKIPILLEIALLSVPTPSPRHRDREQHWIEQLFTSLLDCIVSSDLPHNTYTMITTNMLEAIRQHGSLSSQKLSDIIENHLLSATAMEGQIDWKLVRKAIEIDVSAFTKPSIAEPLFDAVSAAILREQEPKELSTSLREHVIIPVMTAFAQSRTLSSFVILWKMQLDSLQDYQNDQIWTQLSNSFADLVEPTLSHEQFLDQLTALQASIAAFTSSQDIHPSGQPNASLVLLHSYLRGVQSDDFLDKIHHSLYPLMQIFFKTAELKLNGRPLEPQAPFWNCLKSLFKLWFPLWAVEKEDNWEPINAEKRKLVTNQAFNTALSVLKSASTWNQSNIKSAGLYIAAVCNVCSPSTNEQNDMSSVCTMAIETLANVPDLQLLGSFIQYPKLWMHLSESKRQKLLLKLFTSRGKDDHDLTIKAIMSSANSSIVEQSATILVRLLETTFNDDGGDSTLYDDLMIVFTILPSRRFTKDQRHTVLNRLIDPKTMIQKPCTPNQFETRLAVILHLLQPSSEIPADFIDLSHLWSFADAINGSPSTSSTRSVVNREIFEVIVRRLVSCLLDQSNHQKNLEIVKLFFQKIDDECTKDGFVPTPETCTIVKVFLDTLESRQHEAVTQDLKTSCSRLINVFLEHHLQQATHLISQLRKPLNEDDGNQWMDLYLNLEAAGSLCSCSTFPISEFQQKLGQLSIDIVDQFTSTHTHPENIGTVVLCFVLACEFSKVEKLSLLPAALRLLACDVNAREHAKILRAYTRTSSTDIKHAILRKLIEIADPASLAYLQLWDAIISEFVKGDFEPVKGNSEPVKNVLPATLHMQTLEYARASENLQETLCALRTVNRILQEKPFMISQQSIELTMSTLVHVLRNTPHAAVIYLKVCQTFATILTQHRSRVQDRPHLIVVFLDALLSPLFDPPKTTRPSSKLAARHATSFARLLVTFCNRRTENRPRRKSSELVDKARKLQIKTGEHARAILHRYCTLVLSGTPAEGVREALQPGLWAIIEAMELRGEVAIKSLSAAMDNSERAVLRSVYDDWKRYGKWEGL